MTAGAATGVQMMASLVDGGVPAATNQAPPNQRPKPSATLKSTSARSFKALAAEVRADCKVFMYGKTA
jgi:hypothetical protein